jgi:multimeric flavodoxin WrbA
VIILALMSSYRKNGNTSRIVQMVATRLEAMATQQDRALTFEMLYLGELDIRPCRGCRTCFDRGEERCPLQDDVPAIKAKMDAADGVILASPVYVDDVNGIAKNLVDRLAYVCHRPAFAGKCAYTVATVGSSPTDHALRTMNTALLTWGYHLVGHVGYKTGALMPSDEMKSRYGQETGSMAEDLYRAISQRHALRPSFLSLMTFKIQQLAGQRKDRDSLDYIHWKRHGWLDPDCTFYVAHHAAPVKVALARLVGAAIARFMS